MTRPLLDDRQCRLFLKDMRGFGYDRLTLADVVRVANLVHRGKHSQTDVIAVIMAKQIDEALEAK